MATSRLDPAAKIAGRVPPAAGMQMRAPRTSEQRAERPRQEFSLRRQAVDRSYCTDENVEVGSSQSNSIVSDATDPTYKRSNKKLTDQEFVDIYNQLLHYREASQDKKQDLKRELEGREGVQSIPNINKHSSRLAASSGTRTKDVWRDLHTKSRTVSKPRREAETEQRSPKTLHLSSERTVQRPVTKSTIPIQTAATWTSSMYKSPAEASRYNYTQAQSPAAAGVGSPLADAHLRGRESQAIRISDGGARTSGAHSSISDTGVAPLPASSRPPQYAQHTESRALPLTIDDIKRDSFQFATPSAALRTQTVHSAVPQASPSTPQPTPQGQAAGNSNTPQPGMHTLYQYSPSPSAYTHPTQLTYSQQLQSSYPQPTQPSAPPTQAVQQNQQMQAHKPTQLNGHPQYMQSRPEVPAQGGPIRPQGQQSAPFGHALPVAPSSYPFGYQQPAYGPAHYPQPAAPFPQSTPQQSQYQNLYAQPQMVMQQQWPGGHAGYGQFGRW